MFPVFFFSPSKQIALLRHFPSEDASYHHPCLPISGCSNLAGSGNVRFTLSHSTLSSHPHTCLPTLVGPIVVVCTRLCAGLKNMEILALSVICCSIHCVTVWIMFQLSNVVQLYPCSKLYIAHCTKQYHPANKLNHTKIPK